MKKLKAAVLLGWMERDHAITFLRRTCIFESPLSESKARRIWEKYKKGVDSLGPRDAHAPTKLELNEAEKKAAEALLKHYEGSDNILEVVKIDPFDLVVRQFWVITDHPNGYATACANNAGWIKEALPIPVANKTPDLKKVRIDPYTIDVHVPHGEFGIFYDQDTEAFRIQEFARYISVTAYEERMLLWAGYHRTYACMSKMNPDPIARSLAMVLTTDGAFEVSAASPNQGLRAILRGPRPPLFTDFFDDRLRMMVTLPRARFELHVRAQVVPIAE